MNDGQWTGGLKDWMAGWLDGWMAGGRTRARRQQLSNQFDFNYN